MSSRADWRPTLGARLRAKLQQAQLAEPGQHAQLTEPGQQAQLTDGQQEQEPSARSESQSSVDPRRIVFWSGHLCERGTDTALYDYADCAETELDMRSYVLYDIDSPDNFSGCVARFTERFGPRLIGVKGFTEVDSVLARERIKWLYMIKIVDDKLVSKLPDVRNLVHAVFFANSPHGHVYARISPCVPKGNKKQTHDIEVPIVPHIVRRAVSLDGADLREELGIPADATVFGRHGGFETFDLPFVREVVARVAAAAPHIFFVLVNTPIFCDPLPNVMHLPKTSDAGRKAAFIRTCDAMLHARQGGESFGLAIAEFSSHNRPVLTSSVHTDEGAANFHLQTLGARGLYYHDARSLLQHITAFDRVAAKQRDWNAYRSFEPKPVMALFASVFLRDDAVAFEPVALISKPAARLTDDAALPSGWDAKEAARAELSQEQRELLKKCEVLDRELGDLVRLPKAVEEPFRSVADMNTEGMPDGTPAGRGQSAPVLRRFVCCFTPHVPVRFEPSTCAGIASTVACGQEVVASARRGLWVRINSTEAPSARWMLTVHPLHGELLRPVEQ